MMKGRILSVFLAVFLLGTGFESSARADDAAVDFRLDTGHKVIFLPIPDTEVAALKIVIPGTSLRQNADTAGVERLLVKTMLMASETLAKDEVSRRLDAMGTRIWSSVEKDRTVFSLQCVRPFFKHSLSVFADLWQRPLLDENDVILQRDRQLAMIRSKHDNPDEWLSEILNRTFYQGHPYESDVDGEEEPVKAFDRAALKSHHAKLVKDPRAFIVVAGPFLQPDLERWLNAAFHVPQTEGDHSWALPELNRPSQNLVFETRAIPTKYILGKFCAPAPGKADYAALKIGMKLLSYRLWESVRTKRGLAYAVYSGLSASQSNFGYLYVTTVDEAQTMALIVDELQRLATTPPPQAELDAVRAVYRTQFYQGIESVQGQAEFLALSESLLDGYHNRQTVMEQVGRLTPSEVQKAVARTAKDFTFGILGPGDVVDETIFAPVQAESKTIQVPQNNPIDLGGDNG